MNGGECFIPRYDAERRVAVAALSAASRPVGLRLRGLEQREPVADGRVAFLQLLRGAPASAGGRRGCRCSSARCRRGRSAVPYAITSTPMGSVTVVPASPLASARAPGRPAAPASPGAVSGSTPWPRLKTCPGRPPAAAQHVAAPSPPTTSHGARQAAGSRLPWTRDVRARSAPRPRRAARASRRRPRRRPPARIRASSSPVPTPKWIARHAEVGEAGEHAAHVRAARSARSRRGRARRPSESNSCTACAPASTCARRYATATSARARP